MDLRIGQSFDLEYNNWDLVQGGSGVVSVDSTKRLLTVDAPLGSTAHVKYDFVVFPGDLVELLVYAIDNETRPGKAEIRLNSPSGSIIDSCEVIGPLREYRLSYSVPSHFVGAQKISLYLGAFTSSNANASYTRPRVGIRNSSVGQLRSLVGAVLALTTSGVTVRGSFIRHGISSVSWDGTAKEITVTCEDNIGFFDGISHRPLIFVSQTLDGVDTVNTPVHWTSGAQFNGQANTFKIVGFNSDGTRFDISTLGAKTFFLYLEVRG